MRSIFLPRLVSILFFSVSLFFGMESLASVVTGNINGNIVVEEFFDYQCPHCRTMLSVTELLARNNNDVKLVTRVVPLLDKNSWTIARAVLAARKQGKYPAFHHMLMQERSYITEDRLMSLARSAQINIILLKRDMNSKIILNELKVNIRDSRARGVDVIPAIFAHRVGRQSGELRFVGDKSYSDLQASIMNL
ncbi:MAG: DsbA family protein [Gammaproteobacteria bacterium]|nr:DsbA family protein [Gammaproteobacteria bacterium]